jgi:hypothetical protein
LYIYPILFLFNYSISCHVIAHSNSNPNAHRYSASFKSVLSFPWPSLLLVSHIPILHRHPLGRNILKSL